MTARDDLERELRRVCDRVAGLSLARLESGEPSPADTVRAAAQRIADFDAQAEGREPGTPLPQLSPFALPDQLTVVTTDLLLATGTPGAGGDAQTEGAAQQDTLLNDALAVLVELRRAL